MTGSTDTAAGLEALIAGKRRVPRTQVQLPVRVKGVHGEFEGEVHDISMDGALVRLPISGLTGSPDTPLGPAEQFALLERHFRDSFDLRFLSCEVIVEAQVVRLLVGTPEEISDEPQLALGCRFVSPLTVRQQEDLGLFGTGPGLEAWGEATARHAMRHASDPARPVMAFLFDGHEGTVGPRFVGLVRAIGRTALTVRIHGVSREEVRDLMSGGQVPTRVLRGARELFDADLEFVTARYCDRPSPGVEVLLAAKSALPRSVRRNFRKA